MALDFNGGTTHKVNIGSSSLLDDILGTSSLAGGVTIAAWFKISIISAKCIFQKGVPAVDSTQLTLNPDGSGRFSIQYNRATSIIDVRATATNFAAYAVNKWLFLAGVIDMAGASSSGLYMGDLVTPAGAPASYAARTLGSGAHVSDAGLPAIIGNKSNDGGNLPGPIAWVAVWKRALSFQEILEQQWRRHVSQDCVYFAEFGFNGAGTQPDWSGNSHAGTVTGTTVAAHVPGRPLFGAQAGWQGAAAAAGGGVSIPVMVHQLRQQGIA